MARPVALDHNFPEPLLRCITPWVPGVEFAWVRDIDAGLAAVDDHELIYELRDRGFTVVVTNNWKMENDVRVLVAVEQTRSSLLTLKKAGDDAIFATGVLLRDLLPLLKAEVPRGQVFRASPSKIVPRRARQLMGRFADAHGTDIDGLIRNLGRR
jgi:hypothetical protein